MSKKYVQVLTPKGEASYAWLTKPREDKFNPGKENYEITMTFDESDVNTQEMITKLDTMLKDYLRDNGAEVLKTLKSKGKTPKDIKDVYNNFTNRFYKNHDMEESIPEGKIRMSFKTASKVEKKDGTTFERHVSVVDAKANRITDTNLLVGNGSICRVQFEANVYNMLASGGGLGVSIKLQAVQIIKLEEYTGSSDALMFDESEEDGYVHTATAPSQADDEELGEDDF
jgi:hypothetical protein